MLDEVKYCQSIINHKFNKDLFLTLFWWRGLFSKINKLSYFCWKKYNKPDKRVRDHCHVTGKYHGSPHESCNLNFKATDKIPVIFHNLTGYDSHFIMQKIGDVIKKKSYKNKQGEVKQMTLNAIPNNVEKYIAIMLGQNVVFIDSFQFMSQSLEKLVNNLTKDDLKYISEIFKDKALKVMSQKGVYPYDYMDSFGKFNQTTFPLKEQFCSQLSNEHISDEDYKHAKRDYKGFGLKNWENIMISIYYQMFYS